MHVVGLAAEMSALVAVKPRQFIKTVAAIGTPERLTQRAISTITRVGALVTVTTSVNHEFETGDDVEIEGINQAVYNGRKKIDVTGATTFTYGIEGNPADPTFTTATASAHLWCRRATFLGKKAATTPNATAVRLGPSSGNDTQGFDLAVSGESELQAMAGSRHNLRDWYLDVGTAGDGVVILFM